MVRGGRKSLRTTTLLFSQGRPWACDTWLLLNKDAWIMAVVNFFFLEVIFVKVWKLKMFSILIVCLKNWLPLTSISGWRFTSQSSRVSCFQRERSGGAPDAATQTATAHTCKLCICNHWRNCSNLWIRHINIYLLSPRALMITSALLFQLLQSVY